jgi:predicted transcriptional regulator
MVQSGSNYAVRHCIKPGMLIALYEASPTKALAGFLCIEKIYHAAPEAVWSQMGGLALMSRAEYEAYFSGSRSAFAIQICHALPLPEPVSLRSLRRRCPGFMPPQSFRYLATLPPSLVRLLGDALTRAVGPRRHTCGFKQALG